tara:strand:- start:4383 stop:4613 length:231 start_codon:yes stop_codon:yes gene_type:complete
MESSLPQLIIWFFGIGAILVFLIIAAFFFNQKILKTKNKAPDSKELLKDLLEGFGLEVPAELIDSESTAVNSIKAP